MTNARHDRLLRRLIWFAGLWLAGAATVALAAYGIRLLIGT